MIKCFCKPVKKKCVRKLKTFNKTKQRQKKTRLAVNVRSEKKAKVLKNKK